MTIRPPSISSNYTYYLKLVAEGLSRDEIKRKTGWTHSKLSGIVSRGKKMTDKIAELNAAPSPKPSKSDLPKPVTSIPLKRAAQDKKRNEPLELGLTDPTIYDLDPMVEVKPCLWAEYRCTNPRALPHEVNNCRTVYCTDHFKANRERLFRVQNETLSPPPSHITLNAIRSRFRIVSN